MHRAVRHESEAYSLPFCAKCGTELASEASFCPKYGTPTHGASAEITDQITDALKTAGRELETAFKTAGEEIEKAFSEVKHDLSESSGPFCVKCGTRNPADAKFCFACGRDIPQAT